MMNEAVNWFLSIIIIIIFVIYVDVVYRPPYVVSLCFFDMMCQLMIDVIGDSSCNQATVALGLSTVSAYNSLKERSQAK